jgi:hypothetical protein
MFFLSYHVTVTEHEAGFVLGKRRAKNKTDCTYNVTLRHIHATIVAGKSNNYYML